MHSDQVVILFIKAPLPGSVKSRLATGLGPDVAADLYRRLILDSVDTLAATGYSVRIHYSPPEAAGLVAELLGRERPLLAQVGADLGEKMENALYDAFAAGYERAILVGSDIPELTGTIINEALDALERHDAVLGPAADGGYYLIGFRRGTMRSDAFHGIAWSTSAVFGETMKIMRAKALQVHVLPQLNDLDSAADLEAFWKRNRNGLRRSRALEYIEKHQKALFAFHQNLK